MTERDWLNREGHVRYLARRQPIWAAQRRARELENKAFQEKAEAQAAPLRRID